MSMTDPIADMIVRMKNALAVGKQTVKMPSSKMKLATAGVLKSEGYIADARVSDVDGKPVLEIVLKYFEGKLVICISDGEGLNNDRRNNLSQLPVFKAT